MADKTDVVKQWSYDAKKVLILGKDGKSASDVGNALPVDATNTSSFKIKVYTDVTYTYLCKADPGTLLTAASWQISRWNSTGSSTHADGNSDFDNLATDLGVVQALTYS